MCCFAWVLHGAEDLESGLHACLSPESSANPTGYPTVKIQCALEICFWISRITLGLYRNNLHYNLKNFKIGCRTIVYLSLSSFRCFCFSQFFFFCMIYIVGEFFFNSLHFAFVTFLAVIKYPDEIQVRGKEFILAYSSSGDLVQHGRKGIWHSSQEAEWSHFIRTLEVSSQRASEVSKARL